jgi:predicted metal-binding membrane protein
MEASRLPRLRPVGLGIGQAALVCTLLVLSVVGWLVTGDRMAGMDAGPGTDPGTLGFYITAWVVMMGAMMFPSAAPMVLTFNRVEGHRRSLGRSTTRPVANVLFVGGYLLSWALFGLAAFALLQFIRSLSIDALSWNEGGRYLAGGVIAAAAVYQLTPAKDVCLRHCRGPLHFIMGHWRDGYFGALRMGVEHGAWCVGCCWALMATLFALGVMNLGWMVFVAALIAVEKTLPWKAVANRGIAVLLLILGLSVAIVPGQVPGLTLPDSPKAKAAMGSMQMDKGDAGMTKSGSEMKNRGKMKSGGEMKSPGKANSPGQSMK